MDGSRGSRALNLREVGEKEWGKHWGSSIGVSAGRALKGDSREEP
jgi:hypothetical protein